MVDGTAIPSLNDVAATCSVALFTSWLSVMRGGRHVSLLLAPLSPNGPRCSQARQGHARAWSD